MNASGALRPLGALLREIIKILGFGRRAGVSAVRTTTKSGASEAARKLSKSTAAEVLGDELAEAGPQGFETLLFKQLPRPRLTERSASELTVEQAKEYSQRSGRFYGYNFPLFTGDDFFYEEVEEEFLMSALGADEDSIDRRFLDVMLLFRRTLNDNTRTMLVCWAPLLFLGSLVTSVFFAVNGFGSGFLSKIGIGSILAQSMAVISSGLLVGLFVVFLMFSWPYKVVQQRNLMNLDNYLTSKFARINHNFQVAKRRALNVERDKRMNQREELKEDAGAWTVSYHWFAMRILLCELTIRNKFYQVRRNTTLYWSAGTIVSIAGLLGVLAAGYSQQAPTTFLTMIGVSGLAVLLILSAILRRVPAMMLEVMEANEWNRFHLVNLHNTIADHVGEDKVQIVTFRDRNRFE